MWGEDAEVRVSWRQTIRGRGGHGCGRAAERKRKVKYFCYINLQMTPYYRANCTNLCILEPNCLFEKVAIETINLNLINTVRRASCCILYGEFHWILEVSSFHLPGKTSCFCWSYYLFPIVGCLCDISVGEEPKLGKIQQHAEKVTALTLFQFADNHNLLNSSW